MRRIFWLSCGVLVFLLVCSYFRPLAFDCQLTNTVWFQVTLVDGGARTLAIRGDSSASWTAATVIERDKNTWRRVLSSDPRGRVSHYGSPVDTSGTYVDSYRVDVPLVPLLLMILALSLSIRLIRRRMPPRRLVWEELWTPGRNGHRSSGIVRRGLLVLSLALALAATLLWAGSYIGLPDRWKYFGDSFALARAKVENDFKLALDAEDIDKLHELIAGVENGETDRQTGPEKHLSLEVLRGSVAFHYYSWDAPTGSVPRRVRQKFAGVEIIQGSAAAPMLTDPRLPNLVSAMGSKSLRTERTVVVPFWMLVMLFALWPVLSFIRGPLRRARRRAAGCCRHCGYNLTGNTSGVCPECGQCCVGVMASQIAKKLNQGEFEDMRARVRDWHC
ncbi:MAG: hypothetical protein JSU86_08395 [Phycisphaerales bacterium]|nr:MAG: hypothetical protein JSU86_08395 [Phycisphaerales bacterium]